MPQTTRFNIKKYGRIMVMTITNIQFKQSITNLTFPNNFFFLLLKPYLNRLQACSSKNDH